MDKSNILPMTCSTAPAILERACGYSILLENCPTGCFRESVEAELETAWKFIAELWPGHYHDKAHFVRTLGRIVQRQRLTLAEFVLVPVDLIDQGPGHWYLDIMKGDTSELVRLSHYHSNPTGQLYRIERIKR